jgi:hypothetical protein
MTDQCICSGDRDANPFNCPAHVYSGSRYGCGDESCDDFFCKKGCFRYECVDCCRGTNRQPIHSNIICPTPSCLAKREEHITELIKSGPEFLFKVQYYDEYICHKQKEWHAPLVYVHNRMEYDPDAEKKKYCPFQDATTVKVKKLSEYSNLSIIPVNFVISEERKLGYPVYAEDGTFVSFWNFFQLSKEWIQTPVYMLNSHGNGLLQDEDLEQLDFLFKTHFDKKVKDLETLKKVLGDA